jgi:hypothetical protein
MIGPQGLARAATARRGDKLTSARELSEET